MKKNSIEENRENDVFFSAYGYSCGLSCSYYFSNGYAARDCFFSSASHGFLYNAASRAIIDGGRKAIATAAMAGMLAQNFEAAAMAEIISTGQSASVPAFHFSSGYTVVGSGATLDIYGMVEGTAVSSGGTENVYDGGYSFSAIIHSAGMQNIYDGGSAVNVSVYSAGIQAIRQKGYDSAVAIYAGGFQVIYDEGVSYRGVAHIEGRQEVLSKGLASATMVNPGGWLYVHPGGSAIDVFQNSMGVVLADVGKASGMISTVISGSNWQGTSFSLTNGIATGFAVNGGSGQALVYNSDGSYSFQPVSASLNVYSGGIASETVINSGGIVKVSSGGRAISTTINSGGVQYILSGGAASSTTISYGGWQIISSGGSAIDYVLAGGSQRVEYGGYAHRITISGSGSSVYQVINSGAVAENVGLYESGIQQVFSGGLANSTIINSSGVQSVYAGGTAASTIINSGGIQFISWDGYAHSTIVNSGGVMSLFGSADHLIVNSLGSATAYMAAFLDDAVASGGNIYVFNAQASNVTVIDGGHLTINGFAGSAAYTVVSSSATMDVSSGESVSASLYGEQFLRISGRDKFANIYNGGSQVIEGISALATHAAVQGGGSQILSTGSANATYVNEDGALIISAGGIARNAVIASGGSMVIMSGGSAKDIVILPGGFVTVSSGGNLSGYADVHSGVHGQVNIKDGANVYVPVANGGTHVGNGITSTGNVIVSGGSQIVSSGGSSINTNIYSGGYQTVQKGGYAESTYINNSASQVIESDGNAVSTMVNYGGKQIVSSGGAATETWVNPSGTMSVCGNAVSAAIKGGVQSVISGGQDSFAEIQSGGIQIISNGGMAEQESIKDNGSQQILNGGSASGASVSSGGSQIVSPGGTAAGTLVSNGGIQYVYSGAVASGISVFDGGNVQAFSGAVFSGTTNLKAGGTIDLVRTGSSPANIYLDNLLAEGGVFNMNVNLEDHTGDRIILSGNHSGGAYISLTNVGASENSLIGDSLKLVEYTGTATLEEDASFSLVGGVWDTGPYEYVLEQGDEAGNFPKDYYLRNTKVRTNIFKTMATSPIIGVASVRAAMNSLQKRMGDLRTMNSSKHPYGIWARGYYKGMTVSDTVDADISIAGAEAGYDFRAMNGRSLYNTFSAPELYLGFMAGSFSISDIKTDFSSVKSEGDGSGFLGGIYATMLSDRKWFADATVRFGNLELDMKTYSSTGMPLSFSPSRSVFAVSLEAGKMFEPSTTEGWRAEPKAELSLVSMGATKTPVTNGLSDLELKGANYISGSAGVYASILFITEDNYLVEPFAELSFRQELSGEEKVVYGGVTSTSEMKGNSIEARAGINIKTSDDTYWYAAASYEGGANIKSYGANVGMRLMFNASTAVGKK